MSSDSYGETTRRFLSVEMLMTLCITLFAIGGAWSTLAGDNEDTKREVSNMKLEQKQIKQAVQTIQVDVATIKANQEAQRESGRKQQKDIDRILDILERRDL